MKMKNWNWCSTTAQVAWECVELAALSTTKMVRLFSCLFLLIRLKTLILLFSFILEEEVVLDDFVVIEKCSELEPIQESGEVISSIEDEERSSNTTMQKRISTLKELKSAILPSFLKFFKKIFERNEEDLDPFSADEVGDERFFWLRGRDFGCEDDEDGSSYI